MTNDIWKSNGFYKLKHFRNRHDTFKIAGNYSEGNKMSCTWPFGHTYYIWETHIVSQEPITDFTHLLLINLPILHSFTNVKKYIFRVICIANENIYVSETEALNWQSMNCITFQWKNTPYWCNTTNLSVRYITTWLQCGTRLTRFGGAAHSSWHFSGGLTLPCWLNSKLFLWGFFVVVVVILCF